ncbi:hypothetical protein DVS77_33330 [Mycolicibacterium moriokaense]|nr:hypothetical protein DVS77_33330 [Mycolicibacterium moriokaense]
MPHLYRIGTYTIAANSSLDLPVAWAEGWLTLDRGPVLFRAIPIPPKDGLLFKPLWVTEYGVTAATLGGYRSTYGYVCKVRNDNSVAADFYLDLLTFDDIGVTTWPNNWKGPLPERTVERMKSLHPKLTILTDGAGNIVGTAIHNGSESEINPLMAPGPDQRVHVIDLSEELQEIDDLDDLYRKLERRLKQLAF